MMSQVYRQLQGLQLYVPINVCVCVCKQFNLLMQPEATHTQTYTQDLLRASDHRLDTMLMFDWPFINLT